MMPLKQLHKTYSPKGRFIYIYDGSKFLVKLFIPDYDSKKEAERIADLLIDLLGNHGANDDTTGLYDDEL